MELEHPSLGKPDREAKKKSRWAGMRASYPFKSVFGVQTSEPPENGGAAERRIVRKCGSGAGKSKKSGVGVKEALE